MLLVILLAITCVLAIAAVYFISHRKYGYWKKRGIPYLKPTPILGNYGKYILLKQQIGEASRDICEKLDDEPLVGAFLGTEPILLVQDPEFIKTVLSKDFYYFSSREVSEYVHSETLFRNLLSNYGDEWKVLRQNLTPLFSSAKMKNMFPLIETCAKQLDALLSEQAELGVPVKMRSLIARYSMDCLCSCAFGINSNVMAKDHSDNPFSNVAKSIFKVSNIYGLKFVLRGMWPGIFYKLRQQVMDQEVTEFFNRVLTEVFEKREYKPTSRNDLVDAMLNLYNKSEITGDSIESMNGGSGKVTLKVDKKMLVDQCFIFFTAGYDTTANTISLAMFELAKQPKLQERAIQEIEEYLIKNGNKLDYSVISSLPFVESCIDETLRLYPVLGSLPRQLYKDYRLPNGSVLDAGLRVHIPTLKIQRSAKFFPNPDQFDPDRFSAERKHEIQPYTYLPFGEGPRHCIGMRFSKMVTFSGLVTILSKYRVTPTKDTPTTIAIEPKLITMQPRDEFELRLERRK